jgi:hypothetical protein
MQVKYISQQGFMAPQSGIAPWIDRMRLSNVEMRPTVQLSVKNQLAVRSDFTKELNSRGPLMHAIQLLTRCVRARSFMYIRKI